MGGMARTLLRHAPAVLGVALLVGAIYVLQREFRGLKIADIQAALGELPTGKIVLSFLWTLLSYGILTFYDRLAKYADSRSQGTTLKVMSKPAGARFGSSRQRRGGR